MKLYKKVIEHRVTMTETVDLAAQLSPALVTVIHYGRWFRRVYLFGRYSKILTRIVR